MTPEKVEVQVGREKTICIETGKLAKQAAGSVVVTQGETKVLVTVCQGREVDGDFFPLTVEYREKAYAAGNIPGGFFKREAKASETEILTCRLIDRPIRPLFPKGYRNEVQVIASVINADGKHNGDTAAIIGASVAVGLSPLPFEKQVASVRVVRVEGEFIVCPTYEETENSDMELVVAGSEDSIVMVEGGAYEIPEENLVEAIMKGHEAIKSIVAVQKELINRVGKSKKEIEPKERDGELFNKVESFCVSRLNETFRKPKLKMEFYAEIDEIKTALLEDLAFGEEEKEKVTLAVKYFEEVEKREMREMILSEQVRIDGRKPDEVRPIYIETGLLPHCHGSALFQRGETQAMVVCTLGSKTDEQKVDALQGDWYKSYYLHYNFPPFSVGETGRMFGPGRREIGHGHLAERSLEPILPTSESFPYTIRIVSEILESHGSSSMASVCGGSLSLMNTGVPVKTAVSGIAMGLITDGDRTVVLSDINGTEDHLGDMDFKICGTKDGITGFQMDIKIAGITPEVMMQALTQANAGRMHILEHMNAALDKPQEISKLAPSILKRRIPPDKIKDLIGPGGRMIRHIQESSGTNIDINDEGEVTVTGPQKGNTAMAMKMIEELFEEVQVGKQYKGTIKSITSFGVFVEILPGKEGLVHVSELGVPRGTRIEDKHSLGQELLVKCINIDHQGKVRLSASQVESE